MRRDFIERLMLFESSSASYPSRQTMEYSNITSSVKCSARICENFHSCSFHYWSIVQLSNVIFTQITREQKLLTVHFSAVGFVVLMQCYVLYYVWYEMLGLLYWTLIIKSLRTAYNDHTLQHCKSLCINVMI